MYLLDLGELTYMGITQKDIARNLGVSFMTVSRAMNGSGYVSEELKQKILDYAKDQGYVPHRASQVLVRNTIRNIALFSSSLPEYFWDDIAQGVELAAKELQPFNYAVRYHRVPELDSKTYLNLLDEELERGLDGIAIVNQRKYDMPSIIEKIKKAGIPFVTYNIDAINSGRNCYIGSDYAAGGRLAADFIANTLRLSEKKEVLVIQCDEHLQALAEGVDINKLRWQGFSSMLAEKFPEIVIHLEFFDTKLQEGYKDNQILDILRKYAKKVQAIYLIPAFNTDFLSALNQIDAKDTVTILHDLDSNAMHDLDTHQLSAVVHQSPELQGYYSVKALEQLIEAKDSSVLPDREIVHTLVLSENKDLIQGLVSMRFLV